jgi:hypothetical protein
MPPNGPTTAGRPATVAGVRRGRLGVAAVVIVLAAAVPGCAEVVPGVALPTPSTGAEAAAPASPTASPGAPPGPRSGLDADPIADECLLDAAEFGALVGTAVRPPAQDSVPRRDGSAGFSCVATAGTDPVAMINVYRVRSGTPAGYVRAGGPGGHRDLPGVGDAAAVFDTEAGPTLQVAGRAYLVTILVAGREPSDDAWRTAATAALSRLPG